MPVPVSHTGAKVDITQQGNASMQTEGPFERAARLKREAEAAGQGREEPQKAARGAPQHKSTASQPAAHEKLQGDAIIDVNNLSFCYPGLGGWVCQCVRSLTRGPHNVRCEPLITEAVALTRHGLPLHLRRWQAHPQPATPDRERELQAARWEQMLAAGLKRCVRVCVTISLAQRPQHFMHPVSSASFSVAFTHTLLQALVKPHS